jgi:hypothetical protein
MYFLVILIIKTIIPVIGIPKKNIKIPIVKIGEYITPRIIRIKNKNSIISKNLKWLLG